ncbi:putative flavoprotein involved in K+ transport [Marinactinospora thermotolerans DSM 45154]|uniref:Putative flavoprotein involved in K+ transport n=1 Tax=Marinactinospora thermotolerans DSM 45154 TaxID=1122192 RepID=A0A1T4NAY8_9ACTN|nr:putative flavoprotein involved in K+ transport [Marinactinospora thermotolerans DSM 45154]
MPNVNGRLHDVVVVGGGQAGLAVGYFLRRAGLDYVILDAEDAPGGSWRHYWESLRLFSPAEHSVLPGWWMPRQEGRDYPDADHVARYLAAYERRYALAVRRPVRVRAVRAREEWLTVETDTATWRARRVVSATGTWRAPFVPAYPGRAEFGGLQLHTVGYRRAADFRGQRVLVVGGGNSAAQILADVSRVAETVWATRRPPRLLPDDVDGRVLFDAATERVRGNGAGGVVGHIVVVPEVGEARARGVLRAEPMFDRLTRSGALWPDGTHRDFDAVTGVPGSVPSCPTWALWGCAVRAVGSRSRAPVAEGSPACTWWATATGPGRPRPP